MLSKYIVYKCGRTNTNNFKPTGVLWQVRDQVIKNTYNYKYVCTQHQVSQIHKASIVYKGKDRYKSRKSWKTGHPLSIMGRSWKAKISTDTFNLNYAKPIELADMHRTFHCLLLPTQVLLYLSSLVCVCSTLGWLSARSELSLATVTSCYMSPALLIWS